MGAAQFVEAVSFTLGGGGDANGPPAGKPVVDVMKDRALLCFMQDKVASVEVGKGSAIGFEIRFVPGGIVSEYDVGVLDSFIQGEDRIAVTEPVRQVQIQRGWSENEFGMIESPDRNLRIKIELPKRLEFTVKEFEPQGSGSLHGKDIEDCAAAGKLLARMDLGNLLQAGREERFLQLVGIVLPADLQAENGGNELFGRWRGVSEGIGRGESHCR